MVRCSKKRLKGELRENTFHNSGNNKYIHKLAMQERKLIMLTKINKPCPACGKETVFIDTNSSFITEEYVDIPAVCSSCKEELHITYDFSQLTVD